VKYPHRRLLRSAAETAMVFGLLGWLYVAAVAAFRPDDLSVHIAAILPLRRDTFGAACFVGSALSAFGLRARLGTYWVRLRHRDDVAEAALRTTIGFALLAWAYLCVNSLTHPQTTGLHLTHFYAHPAEGTTAVACFAAAAGALFLSRGRTRPED
jgi:hypothetical protein